MLQTKNLRMHKVTSRYSTSWICVFCTKSVAGCYLIVLKNFKPPFYPNCQFSCFVHDVLHFLAFSLLNPFFLTSEESENGSSSYIKLIRISQNVLHAFLESLAFDPPPQPLTNQCQNGRKRIATAQYTQN